MLYNIIRIKDITRTKKMLINANLKQNTFEMVSTFIVNSKFKDNLADITIHDFTFCEKLIIDELDELNEALLKENKAHLIQELVDVVYVLHHITIVTESIHLFKNNFKDENITDIIPNSLPISQYIIYDIRKRVSLLFRSCIFNDKQLFNFYLYGIYLDIFRFILTNEINIFNLAFKIVHNSNMLKFNEDGKPYEVNENGKVQKGPNYVSPLSNLEALAKINPFLIDQPKFNLY